MMGEALYLTGFGLFLAKKKDIFIIRMGDKKEKIPARKIEKIVFLGPAKAISTDAIQLAIKFKIPIFFAYSNGYPYAMIFPTVAVGTVRTRRLQYEAYTNSIGAKLVIGFIRGKLMNQYTLLKLYWKSRKRIDRQTANKIREYAEEIRKLASTLNTLSSEKIDENFRKKVLQIEARAAEAYYWPAFSLLLPKGFIFVKRDKPGAKDPVNALLNLGYSLLFMEVAREIIYAGLDPYAGFLHSDRPGRESLILDAMEEFRQWSVDRLVLRFLTTRKLCPEDIVGSDGKLTKNAVRMFCEEFEKVMETETLNMSGKKRTLRRHIAYQVNLIKRHLLQIEEYSPCIFAW